MGFRAPARIGNFKPSKSSGMDRAGAEDLAAQILVAVAEDPAVLQRFMADTGFGPDDIRRSAGSSDFLAGVLEYVLADEPMLLAITSDRQLKPELLMQALTQLQKPALGSA